MSIRSVPHHDCIDLRPCPTCFVAKGRPCLSASGLLVYAHKARRDPPPRCNHVWERRSPGMRYVYARGQCKQTTRHPSGYCKGHRYQHRWSPEQEAHWLEHHDRAAAIALRYKA